MNTKFALIKNNKVVKVVNSLQPQGYVPVNIKWVKPTDYPFEFYAPNSNKPIYTVISKGLSVDENWSFTLRPIDQVKKFIYSEQRKVRSKMQLGTFDVSGKTIEVLCREDALNILSLTVNYKIKDNEWLEGAANIALLKTAARDHVQNAFNWELNGNKTVTAMTTHDELKTYYESIS